MPRRCKVDFARGFKLPSQTQIAKAIDAPSVETPRELRTLMELAPPPPIPRPTVQDDWLAQYVEPGQSMRDFLRDCPWISSRARGFTRGMNFNKKGQFLRDRHPEGKIYLLPLEVKSEARARSGPLREQDLATLREYTEVFFGATVALLPKVSLCEGGKGRKKGEEHLLWHTSQKSSAACKINSRARRSDGGKLEWRQLDIDSLLAKLKEEKPRDALCMIAVTQEDLFCEPADLFCAGMAAGGSGVAVFSLSRYNPALISMSTEHWWDVEVRRPLAGDSLLLVQRLCKLIVHEVAHLFGVDHCIFFQCCMNGSGSHLTEDFAQPMSLCPIDLHKLHQLFGFDIKERYQRLLAFFQEKGFVNDVQWTTKHLEIMGSDTQISKLKSSLGEADTIDLCSDGDNDDTVRKSPSQTGVKGKEKRKNDDSATIGQGEDDAKRKRRVTKDKLGNVCSSGSLMELYWSKRNCEGWN